MGLVIVVFTHQDAFRGKERLGKDAKPNWEHVNRWLRNLLIGLVWWLLFSLAAVSFVNISPILGIVLAIIGGIYLGKLSVKRFEASSKLKAEIDLIKVTS